MNTYIYRIAGWFIQKGIDENRPIDHLKLQKLVYYAHAWWMAFDKGELIQEKIEAWQYGPVIRELWEEYKYCGEQSIQKTSIEYEVLGHTFSEDLKEFLSAVWNVYGQYTGWQLVCITHKDGEPWKVVHDKHEGDLVLIPIIPNKLIKKIFKKKRVKNAE